MKKIITLSILLVGLGVATYAGGDKKADKKAKATKSCCMDKKDCATTHAATDKKACCSKPKS